MAGLGVSSVEHDWFKHWKMKSIYWNDCLYAVMRYLISAVDTEYS